MVFFSVCEIVVVWVVSSFCSISERETRTDLNKSRILREINETNQKILEAQKEGIWKEFFSQNILLRGSKKMKM